MPLLIELVLHSDYKMEARDKLLDASTQCTTRKIKFFVNLVARLVLILTFFTII